MPAKLALWGLKGMERGEAQAQARPSMSSDSWGQWGSPAHPQDALVWLTWGVLSAITLSVSPTDREMGGGRQRGNEI